LALENLDVEWRVPWTGPVWDEDTLVKLPEIVMSHWFRPGILATQQAEIRRIRVPVQPVQDISETQSQATRQGWWYMPFFPATSEATDMRITLRLAPGK
jgi:hypothetical protein